MIDKKSNAAIENLTDYEVVGIENLGLKNENDPYAYKIQKLGKKYLLLQKVVLSKPEGYEVLSVREVTGLFTELKVEICSKCHPFFTGKQKLVDTGGRVDRFKKRFNME